MDPLTLARALHVLAVVHWIGGVTMVTLVLLPGLTRSVPASERLPLFEMIEGRFAFQARISTVLAGASGFLMLHLLDGWDRLIDARYWWLWPMVVVWMIFTFVLYVAEPLWLHRWFHDRATRDPEGTFGLVHKLHVVLMTASLVTTALGVLGAHGALF